MLMCLVIVLDTTGTTYTFSYSYIRINQSRGSCAAIYLLILAATAAAVRMVSPVWFKPPEDGTPKRDKRKNSANTIKYVPGMWYEYKPRAPKSVWWFHIAPHVVYLCRLFSEHASRERGQSPNSGSRSAAASAALFLENKVINPFRTAVPIRGQNHSNSKWYVPKGDCSPKRGLGQ